MRLQLISISVLLGGLIACSKTIYDHPSKIRYYKRSGFESLEIVVKRRINNPFKPNPIICTQGSITWGGGPLNMLICRAGDDGRLIFTKIPGRIFNITYRTNNNKHYHANITVDENKKFGTAIIETLILPDESCGYSDCPVEYPEITVHWWNKKWWTHPSSLVE